MLQANTTTVLRNLLDRIRTGDEGAVSDFMDRAYHRLRAIAHRGLLGFPRLRRTLETADVLGAAYHRLVRTLRETKPATPADFFCLAARQVAYELIDLCRQEDRAQHVPFRADSSGSGVRASDIPAASTGPEEKVSRAEEFARLMDAIDALDPEFREVIYLNCVLGCTLEDVAAALGISRETVKRRKTKAIDRLGGALPEA